MKSRIINLLTHISIVMAELDFAVHIEGDYKILHFTDNYIFNIFFIDCNIDDILGGDEAANILADKHEMINMGEIIPESGYYLLRSVEICYIICLRMIYRVIELMKTVGGEEV